ncbi:MAG: glucose 1-dehydrogenase [Pseudomonadaceae bacterium]|nr:glucose 1-dehydrogenase [Pseudomonadaceae bacterium]
MTDHDNPYSLAGKIAVVTGGSKGIGRGICLCLARAGADVVVSARTQTDVEAVCAEVRALGRRALGVAADVTKSEEIDALAERTLSELGGLDIWVNNAGGLPDATPRYLTKTPEDRFDAQIDLNLKAVYLGCVAAATRMKASGGSIINISSTSSLGFSLKNGPYGASKAAVNSLTRTLSREAAPKIRVNGVAPGPIPTENFMESTSFREDKPIADQIGVPLGRLGTPEDIGHAVVYLASDAAGWVTGQTLFVNGGTAAQ